MADLPADMLDEVGKSRSTGGGNYFNHGDFIVGVDKWFYQKIQDRCIILETIVVENRKKVVYEGAKAVEQEPNAVGSSASSTANFDGVAKQSAPGNSRAPVLGLFGYAEGSISDEKVKETLAYVTKGEVTAARGMLLAMSTFPKEIRSKKGEFITGLNWSCVAPPGTGVNASHLVAERLAALATGGGEAFARVASTHLAAARAAGGAPGLPTSSEGAVPSLPTSVPALPTTAPALPSLPATTVVDPLTAAKAAGWTVHPGDPTGNLFYKGTDIKSKTDVLAMFPAVAAAPSLPTIPPVPALPAIPAIPVAPVVVDPLAGWTVHPGDPTGNLLYKGTEVKAKADLLAGR